MPEPFYGCRVCGAECSLYYALCAKCVRDGWRLDHYRVGVAAQATTATRTLTVRADGTRDERMGT